MSKTKVLKTDLDWVAIKNECRTTMGKDGTDKIPTEKFKLRLLIAEHSPIRIGSIHFAWDNIKSWIATHFARHWLGWDKWISTQRDDRTNIDRDASRQDTKVRMHIKANPQSLINVARFRLCRQAHPETRKYMEDLKRTINNEVDKNIARVMQPNCIYRCGCPEFESCGYWENFTKDKSMVDLLNIKTRYELADKEFYKEDEINDV